MNEHSILLRAEGGSFNSIVYWQLYIEFRPNETALVSVKSEGKNCETRLSKDQAGRIKEFMVQFRLFDMVSTNYDATLADDCYHLGVTCEYKEAGRRWYHKVPTGPFVIVSSTSPTHDMMYKYLHMITNFSDMSEQLSGLPTPHHVKLRWTSRQKELIALTQIAQQMAQRGQLPTA